MGLRFFHVVVICCTLCSTFLTETATDDSTDEDTTFLINIWNNTRKHSKHGVLHIVPLNPNFDITPLTHVLHKNSVSVVLADVKTVSKSLPWERSKSILFVLNDFSDILNLILGSVSSDLPSQTVSNRNLIKNVNMILSNGSLNRQFEQHFSKWPQFPNYCIFHNLRPGGVLRDWERRCDQTLKVLDNDLNGDSILPDEIFHHTRGLYHNSMWNSQNYLIFFIPRLKGRKSKFVNIVRSGEGCQNLQLNSSDEKNIKAPIHELLFTFKFIWRMFKGHKTVICLQSGCFWYDPFYERISKYRLEDPESYFDFSWFSMNRKVLTVFQLRKKINQIEFSTSNRLWAWFFYKAAADVEKKHNGFLKLQAIYSSTASDESNIWDYEVGLKYGIDLHAVESLLSIRDEDFPNFDFSPAVDTGLVYFVVPRSGFMPQYLTVFKCFTASVWVCLLITSALFLLMHQVYKHLQTKVFSHLYSERELIFSENLSTPLTVYRYFLCIGQPRLFVGRLVTGNVLFVIFVFSSIILATLLQSGMVTLLSNRVRYSDIDTLQELKESDRLVQRCDVVVGDRFLKEEPQLSWIEERLSNSFQYALDVMNDALLIYEELRDWVFNNGTALENLNVTNGLTAVSIASSMKSLDSAMRSDAFLSNGPARDVESKNLFVLYRYTSQKYEFHYVREYVMSYPLMYPVLKFSFYQNVFCDVLFRLIESGIYRKQMDYFSRDRSFWTEKLENENKVETVRPFSMMDLQIAFIVLAIGLLFSVIVFILELLYEF